MIELNIDLTQWIKHDGGGCPVAPDQHIKVLFRRGFTESGAAKRWHLCWQDSGSQSEIVAYRLADVTELRQGDYVSTDGLTDEQVTQMADAFIRCGASAGECYPHTDSAKGYWNFLYWDVLGRTCRGTEDAAKHEKAYRQLTYQQVMDLAKAEEPAEPMWDGKGFPPIGVPFEFSRNGFNSYEPRVMLFNDGVTCLMAHRDYLANRWHYKCDDPHLAFRPIRSEEDRAVDELVEIIADYYGNPKGSEGYIGAARALYRAGYRKTEAA